MEKIFEKREKCRKVRWKISKWKINMKTENIDLSFISPKSIL